MKLSSLPERRIVILGAFNARDLGGLPTTDCRKTKRGRFIRSDLLSGVTDEARETLSSCGVRTVVDLRTTEETLRWPCSLADDARFDYRHCNLEGDEAVPDYDLSQKNHSLAQSYAALLAARRSPIR